MTTCDRILDFCTFLFFSNMFNQCFQDASAQVTEGLVQRSKMGQDVSAWVTEGLTLTDVSFCQKQLLFILDKFSFCESMMCVD